jgi:hypothetical protein
MHQSAVDDGGAGATVAGADELVEENLFAEVGLGRAEAHVVVQARRSVGVARLHLTARQDQFGMFAEDGKAEVDVVEQEQRGGLKAEVGHGVANEKAVLTEADSDASVQLKDRRKDGGFPHFPFHDDEVIVAIPTAVHLQLRGGRVRGATVQAVVDAFIFSGMTSVH